MPSTAGPVAQAGYGAILALWPSAASPAAFAARYGLKSLTVKVLVPVSDAEGIDSLSLNPDTVVDTWTRLAKLDAKA